MIVGIQGTKAFDDYGIFMVAARSILTALSEEDSSLLILTSGPHNVNDMVTEFFNVSERSLRARGIKVKVVKVPPSAIQQRLFEIDFLIFLSKPKESMTALMQHAKAKDFDIRWFRY